MKSFVIESTWLARIPNLLDFGWGNGYVLLSKTHPLYGKDLDELNRLVSIHGGVTLARKVDQSMIDNWEGLDKEDLGFWCVGFDTAHAGDSLNVWSKVSVEFETEYLRAQLLKLEV